MPEDDDMDITELKYKILEVLAYARIISKKYGHTKKYAKHIVALIIKQLLKLTDRELAEFLSRDKIGRMLNYKLHFTFTIFSKVRKYADKIVKELYELTIYHKIKNRNVRLIAQDSTAISAYSKSDKDAKYGHRTPSEMNFPR